MKGRVAVITSSEIIRRGITSIIKSFFNIEVIQVTSASGLKDLSEQNESGLLVFSHTGTGGSPNEVHAFGQKDKIKIITLTDGSGREPDSSVPKGILHLNAEPFEIRKVVSDFLKIAPANSGKDTEGNALTQREKEVLILVASGLSNKEVAARLFISIHTAISHRKNLTEKLGIRSASGLTAYAIINKLIDPSGADSAGLS